MAVTFRSKSPVFNSIGTSATATEPTGAATGDFLLGLYVVDAVSATCALPTGWTSLYSGLVASNFRWNLGWILRGASVPSYAFTHSGSTYRELHVLCFTGNDGTSPVDSSAQSTTGTLNNPDPPSTTAVDAAALAVALGIGWNGSSTAWAHAAYTIRSDNTAGNDAAVATRQLSAAGAENPAAFTGSSGAAGATWAATVTIKPAGGTNATVTAAVADAVSATAPPTVTGGAALTSPPAAATGTVPAPAVSGSSTVTPPPGAGTAPPLAPAASAGAAVTAPQRAATGALPTPTVAGTTSGTVTSPPADGTGAFPAPAVSAGTGTTYRNAVLVDSPYRYWRMGQASGNEPDENAAGDLVVESTVTRHVTGALVSGDDGAAQFSGAGTDYASSGVLVLSDTSAVTIEAWVWWDSYNSTDDHLLLEYRGAWYANSGAFIVDMNSSAEAGTISYGYHTGAAGNTRGTIPQSAAPAAGWHHLVFVLNSGAYTTDTTFRGLKAYVDGSLVTTTLVDAADGGPAFADGTLVLMARSASSLNGAGRLDEVAVYKTELAAGRVAAHYAAGISSFVPGDASVTAPPEDGTGALPVPGVTGTAAVTTPPGSGTGAFPAPTVAGNSAGTVTSPPAAGTGTFPQPAAAGNSAGSVTSPPAAGTGTFPAPTVAGTSAGTVTAVPADATGQFPPANQIISVEVTPGPMSGTGQFPAPGVTGGSGSVSNTVTAVPADGTGQYAPPSLTATANITAVPADGTGAFPPPAVSASGAGTVTPAAATGTGQFPAPGVFAGATVTGMPGAAAGQFPQPSSGVNVTLAAAVMSALGRAMPPGLVLSSSVTAPPADGTGDMPAPGATGGGTPARGTVEAGDRVFALVEGS